jgi:hypothetical protein
MTLSEAGLKLVMDHEVGGGEGYYTRFLSRPTVPGFESGVTIGIGFDLGYCNKSEFENAWASLPQADRLRPAIGLREAEARRFCAGLSDVVIEWRKALQVFLDLTCPTHWLRTLRIYPQAGQLPDDCASALFSLVFNRGNGLTGERRSEMRAIKDALATNHAEAVPGLLRSMKRLWPATSGLVRRREDEARLFEAGLKNG